MAKPIEYEYKGFNVRVTKEKCLGGYDMLFYSITDKNGVIVVDTFTEDETPIRKYASDLEELVDDIIDNPEEYYEEG